MEQKESIQSMITQLHTILNSLKSLGIVISQYDINDKVLIIFPLTLRAQEAALKASKDLEVMPFEKLVGILIIHEQVL